MWLGMAYSVKASPNISAPILASIISDHIKATPNPIELPTSVNLHLIYLAHMFAYFIQIICFTLAALNFTPFNA